YSSLSYSAWLLILSTPFLVLTALTLCGGNSSNTRKDKSSAQSSAHPKHSTDTVSASRVSVRVPSQVELPESYRVATPSPAVTTNPTPSPHHSYTMVMSDYCANSAPRPRNVSVAIKEPLPPQQPKPARKLIKAVGSLESYADTKTKPSIAYEIKTPVKPPPGPPLEPLSSDPLDRSYVLPVRRSADRAPEIEKGKMADPANEAYHTFSDPCNSDFEQNPFSPSSKRMKAKKTLDKTQGNS
ncbi:hypothetical protein PFISCL1PPCAC_18162, partial [Pristionchus fissidentatus]